ncbi:MULTISPECIES: hypothetical protein [unclassified Micromonospora]|uniref:hypothetical protein n=1 Tax=unclassified Micromonospora TaxID=2617518 RepID=UPI0036306032
MSGPRADKLPHASSKAAVLDASRAAGTISRVGLISVTGFTAPTISSLVRRLVDEGQVVETGHAWSTGGKRRVPLRLNHTPATTVSRIAAEIPTLIDSVGVDRARLIGVLDNDAGIDYEVAGMQDLVDAVRATGAGNVLHRLHRLDLEGPPALRAPATATAPRPMRPATGVPAGGSPPRSRPGRGCAAGGPEAGPGGVGTPPGPQPTRATTDAPARPCRPAVTRIR